jgi:hypothetical protein
MPAALSALSEYLRRRPRLTQQLNILVHPVEFLIKKPIFGCNMCGQCVLHSTGMVCPMTCRDRNRLALQADLLGAAALGIPNVR